MAITETGVKFTSSEIYTAADSFWRIQALLPACLRAEMPSFWTYIGEGGIHDINIGWELTPLAARRLKFLQGPHAEVAVRVRAIRLQHESMSML